MAQQFDIIPTGTALGADITDFDIKIMATMNKKIVGTNVLGNCNCPLLISLNF